LRGLPQENDMPLLNDNNFLLTKNVAMLKALTITENLNTMIDVNSIGADVDSLKNTINAANNDLWSFMEIADRYPNSQADEAFNAKTNEVPE